MPDDADETDEEAGETNASPDTYTPRRSHTLTKSQKAPHGDMRDITYEIRAGVTYDVLSGEEADRVLGRALISNVRNEIRESAIPSR